jgi:hypothetical protein
MLETARRWARRILLLAIACTGCVWCWNSWKAAAVPHERFLRLLRGDEEIRVTRVEGTTIARPFVLDDAESLDYITAALRRATPDGYVRTRKRGVLIYVRVWTGEFGGYETSFDVSMEDEVTGMTVFCELDDHYYFWAQLPQPIPAPFSLAIAKASAPEAETVSGTVGTAGR